MSLPVLSLSKAHSLHNSLTHFLFILARVGTRLSSQATSKTPRGDLGKNLEVQLSMFPFLMWGSISLARFLSQPSLLPSCQFSDQKGVQEDSDSLSE